MNQSLQVCLNAFQQQFGDHFTTQKGILVEHGNGDAFYPTLPPDGVFYPLSTAEVALGVKLCAQYRIPVIPYGAGSSLEGHFLAVNGGISFDFSQMNSIVRVSAEDLDCTVQAGVTRKQLNRYLRETGLMFPIDPGADATLGGMAATNASGTNAVRYGTMKDMVISLTVVMANGDIVETASRAKKSSAGYDLTRLMVGSEGTLGVITEVTLKLFGVPEATMAGICSFDALEGAVNAVIQTIQYGLQVGRIELLDAAQIRVLNQYFSASYPEQPTLWFEFSGTTKAMAEQLAIFDELAVMNGGAIIEQAESDQQRNGLWEKRHKLWHATLAFLPGNEGWSTDVCVPISQLARCIARVQLAVDESPLYCSILGHVGDGNFHVIILFDPEISEEVTEARRINELVVAEALSVNGTCTGEHGIGLGKMAYLEQELPSAIPVMKSIKQALDPDNILNPGKVLRI